MSVALGFDSSVLSPFARAKRFDTLEHLVQGHRCVVTRAVLDELEEGCSRHPELASALALPWLALVTTDSLQELRAISHYVRLLGEGERNIGEASILAWAELSSGVALVDDRAAVRAARGRNVQVRRTLGLVCDGVHRKLLATGEACALVDTLITEGHARFPCDGTNFLQWAERNGLLAPE